MRFAPLAAGASGMARASTPAASASTSSIRARTACRRSSPSGAARRLAHQQQRIRIRAWRAAARARRAPSAPPPPAPGWRAAPPGAAPPPPAWRAPGCRPPRPPRSLRTWLFLLEAGGEGILPGPPHLFLGVGTAARRVPDSEKGRVGFGEGTLFPPDLSCLRHASPRRGSRGDRLHRGAAGQLRARPAAAWPPRRPRRGGPAPPAASRRRARRRCRPPWHRRRRRCWPPRCVGGCTITAASAADEERALGAERDRDQRDAARHQPARRRQQRGAVGQRLAGPGFQLVRFGLIACGSAWRRQHGGQRRAAGIHHDARALLRQQRHQLGIGLGRQAGRQAAGEHGDAARPDRRMQRGERRIQRFRGWARCRAG